MHVGLNDYMRSESEPELDNQLSGTLRKSNKQTSILVCLCIYVYEERAHQRYTRHHRSSRMSGVICVSARMIVCWYYFPNLSTVSVCLPVHTVTQTHTHTQATLKTQANTCQEMIENQHSHSSTVSQYATTNTHTHPREYGQCIHTQTRKYSHRFRQTVRRRTNKYIYMYIQTHTHKYGWWYVWLSEERERISVTLVTTAAQGCASDLCMCTNTRVCWYYFPNLSTASVCLPVHALITLTHTHTHTNNTKNTAKYMSRNDRKSTRSLKHSISVLSHEKHAHSLKRWKSGKNAGWQGRQLVVVQRKGPISRRSRELENQLSGVLRIYIYTQTHIHRHTSMIVWGARSNQS